MNELENVIPAADAPHLVFSLGLAALLTALLAAQLLAISFQQVVPLHFDLCGLLVGPPWDSGQQAEVCREQKKNRRRGQGFNLFINTSVVLIIVPQICH